MNYTVYFNKKLKKVFLTINEKTGIGKILFNILNKVKILKKNVLAKRCIFTQKQATVK